MLLMVQRRKVAILGLLFSVVLLGGGSWYFDVTWWNALPFRGQGGLGKDPSPDSGRQLHEEVGEVNWSDPSFAMVGPNETIVELRWYKGKLMHPVGRFFGGHHSALVATGSSGAQVRIEKFGLGNVEFCPTKRSSKRCILHPGMIYKKAGGRFLNNITWSQLHKSMMDDYDHYDVVDANCHHIVQHAWNSAVISSVQDLSPAPDDGVLGLWHDFLHWFYDTEEKSNKMSPIQPPNGTTRSFDAHNQWLDGTPEYTDSMIPARRLQTITPSFDGHNVRRRRRSRDPLGRQGERCRGSKVGEGAENNCPDRQSSASEESSSDGGRVSKKESECYGSKRTRMFFKSKIMSDSDSSGSDCKFFRYMSSGFENDCYGSMHKRWQSSRPSSQSDSYEDSSQEDVMPMDPARIRSDSKDDTASSISQCEIGHSQAGRSKGNDDYACNTRLEGVTKVESKDFICQWTCESGGTVVFGGPSSSKFVCKEDADETMEIALSTGQNRDDCLTACNAKGCADDCPAKCDYLISAALDLGYARCTYTNPFRTSNVLPLEKIDMTTGETVGLIFWIILMVICCCCTGGAGGKSASNRQA